MQGGTLHFLEISILILKLSININAREIHENVKTIRNAVCI